MQKSLIRDIKLHNGGRWILLKNSLKNREQLITPHDRFVFSHLLPGSTLGLSFINLQYLNLIDGLEINDETLDYQYNYNHSKCQNLIMLNDMVLKYKTLDQMKDLIVEKSNTYLVNGGRLILGFNYQFVKFNRLKYDYHLAIDNWLTDLKRNNLNLLLKTNKRIPNTNPYGDNLFAFEFRY